jgi:hypothetical protein
VNEAGSLALNENVAESPCAASSDRLVAGGVRSLGSDEPVGVSGPDPLGDGAAVVPSAGTGA